MEEYRQLIYDGRIDEAITLLEKYISGNQTSDEAFYLLGNAYRKKGNTREALNSYLQAIELNPESPAQQAYNMLMDILNFYNKDMFNH